MQKRFLLVARYYSIEPLGILYLAGAVRDLTGWECKVLLIREFDFGPLYDVVKEWGPDLVGFQIWTGYHIQAFAACDRVRAMGMQVVIGGPHATYFDRECEKHADFVIKGSGFGLFRQTLMGLLPSGMSFDIKGREEQFPLPDRDIVYENYPELAMSVIKSIFASVGCPFTCTYCYAPSFNEMHGGFKLTVRPVNEIITEAKAILKRWPLQVVYFQDDIFGYDKRWLKEFAKRWKEEVGVAFHCQIRLELTRHAAGDERLDNFVEAGCTGITLAIESGNAFLRDRVLFRHMPDELIIEGCNKITRRGMSLRTEQILAVPFSDTATDLSTLHLNAEIEDLTMAWTSILAPYGGTDMGTIANNFGLYTGNNDDLSETFFDRSILRHVAGGPRDIGPIVESLKIHPNARPHDQPLVNMVAKQIDNGLSAEVIYKQSESVGHIEYLDEAANEQYCQDTVRLQRLFNWLSKVPEAKTLGQKLVDVPSSRWSWNEVGRVTDLHLVQNGVEIDTIEHKLATEMGLSSPEELPQPIKTNPGYFAYLPAGGQLAKAVIERGVFKPERTFDRSLDELGTMTRRHLFEYGLYKVKKGPAPIAKS
jgi:hypothetical protein